MPSAVSIVPAAPRNGNSIPIMATRHEDEIDWTSPWGNDLTIVLGTRPEIVKLAPLIRRLPGSAMVIHTGQHYDENMAGAFLRAFGIEEPTHRLAIGGESRGQQIGRAVSGLDELFGDLEPSAVIAQGDTNSTMAAALAANARSVPMIHVEAGLRSHDRNMPEEHNRVVADHLSDLCLAPTQTSLGNLVAEGIPEERIVVTGNTVVDAVLHLLPNAEDRKELLARHGVESGEFVLSTFHRPENVDDAGRLASIMSELASIGRPVLLPLHPRTRAIAQTAGIPLDTGGVRCLEPLGYVEFLGLLAECALAVADSGGLQEEVSVVKKPMVVVRNSTERPEVLGTFCTLVEVGPKISVSAKQWLAGEPHSAPELAEMPSPYGDGDAAERSVAAIELGLRGQLSAAS
jgi:UDP-N-acetylglucosamine 2-epimerase (non-hydrolysing)